MHHHLCSSGPDPYGSPARIQTRIFQTFKRRTGSVLILKTGGKEMVARIIIESAAMVFAITIAGYFIGKLFKEAEKED